MKVHELSFYSQFQCTMGDCPNTCCHGWQVVLDKHTIEKYKTKTDTRGLRLRGSMRSQNGTVRFKGSKGNCPFLTKDRVCQIQLSLGEEGLPDVCRIFPRLRINYGSFAEELLLLSCPQAVRLFLNNLDHLHYQTTYRDVSYAKTGTNDDPGYLQELQNIRSALTAHILHANLPRPMLYAGLLSYARALQRFYITNGQTYGNPSGARTAPTDPAAYLNQASAPFSIPYDSTCAMLTSGFYHPFLKFTSPFLYRLCRIYFKKLHRLPLAKGNARLKALRDELHRDCPDAEPMLRGYLAYYLLEEFFKTYEDYSFVRSIATGIMHTHLLELFFALFYADSHRLTEDDSIQIITVYTRRARHNDTIEKGMYEQIKHLLSSQQPKVSG